jgi:hypothetical protein
LGPRKPNPTFFWFTNRYPGKPNVYAALDLIASGGIFCRVTDSEKCNISSDKYLYRRSQTFLDDDFSFVKASSNKTAERFT